MQARKIQQPLTAVGCRPIVSTFVLTLTGLQLIACGGGSLPATGIIGNPGSTGGNSGGSSGNGSGGGSQNSNGGIEGTGTRTTAGTVGVNSNSIIAAAIDTGISGSIFTAAPAPASFGAAPASAQIAAPGGPTFDGTGGSFPTNVTFPLAASSFEFQTPWDYGDTARAVITDQSATVTVINTSAASTSFQLNIPAVNVNTTINFGENLVRNTNGVTWGLSYVALGAWLQNSPTSNTGGPSFTQFVFGYETPAASMPTTGQAQFSGLADGNIFGSTVNAHILLARVTGNASLAVDFASGKISGALTDMQYLQSSGSVLSNVPWNNVSINANVLGGTNRFSGSTAAASAPEGALSLKGSAAGHIDGAFYGPNAENIGAIWSLSDGNKSAIGGIAAGR